MILLTADAAIFYQMTSGAVLQFDFINSSNAAGGTALYLVTLNLNLSSPATTTALGSIRQDF